MADKKESQTRVMNPNVAAPGGRANTDDIKTAVFANTSNRTVGKLVVQHGPGRGKSVALHPGTNAIGRGDENRVVLNFGDDTISRKQHALITYDEQADEFKIYDGGKPNPIYVNDAELKGNKVIMPGDMIKIGMTLVRFSRS